MRVVRTVFMEEPLVVVLVDGDDGADTMWFRLPVDPREDRFWPMPP